MSSVENTINPERKENQPSGTKAYIKPVISEEVTLPAAGAIVLTPVAYD